MRILFFAALYIAIALSACAQNSKPPESPPVTPFSVNNSSQPAKTGTTPTTAVNSLGSTPFAKDHRTVVAEIQLIVADLLGLKAHEVGVNTPLSKLKKPADALDAVEIMMSIEDHFDITIKDDELGGSDINAMTNITVNELADFVVERKKTK